MIEVIGIKKRMRKEQMSRFTRFCRHLPCRRCIRRKSPRNRLPSAMTSQMIYSRVKWNSGSRPRVGSPAKIMMDRTIVFYIIVAESALGRRD